MGRDSLISVDLSFQFNRQKKSKHDWDKFGKSKINCFDFMAVKK